MDVLPANHLCLSAGQHPSHLRQPIEPGERVVVIGGGDTAMDCVRSALRTSAGEVVCAYHLTKAEMGGREEERRHAQEEGVRFHYLTVPIRFLAGEGGGVQAVRFQRAGLGEPDESGRRRPVPIIGSEFAVEADAVVIAIGYTVEKLLFQTTSGLEATPSLPPERPHLMALYSYRHGAFRVQIEVGDPEGKRFQTVDAPVDTGATNTTPACLLESLGVTPYTTTVFEPADGRELELEVGRSWVKVNGQQEFTQVVFAGEESGAHPRRGVSAAEDDVEEGRGRSPAFLIHARVYPSTS